MKSVKTFLVGLSALVVVSASAEVLIDTLSPLTPMPGPGGLPVAYIPIDSTPPFTYGTYKLGQRFQFNNQNTNQFLTSVSLSLEQYDPNGSITVGLYANNATEPGNFLIALNGPSNPGSGVSTFTPETPFDLKMSVPEYWVVISGTGYGWNISSVPPYDHVDPTTRITWLARYDNGAGNVGWFSGGSDTVIGGGTYALAMQVNAYSTVPEPSTLAITVLGLGGLWARIRRRGRSDVWPAPSGS